MAPRPRKSQPKPVPHVWKIALPFDIAERVKDKAVALGLPQNRVIINELAAYPRLEEASNIAALISHHETLLARYSARISGIDIDEQLLVAVDAVLKAGGLAALETAVERLRVARQAMLALADQAGRKPKTGA